MSVERLPYGYRAEVTSREVLARILGTPELTIDDPAAAAELVERFRGTAEAYRDLAEQFMAGAERLAAALEERA